MRMKVWAVVVCVLALTAVTCSKPKVELVEKTASAACTGWGWGHRPNGDLCKIYYWQECCSGKVTNKGDKIAYEVKVYVTFSSGYVGDDIISEVNLKPGDVGHFSCTGKDSIEAYESETPPVSVRDVRIEWQ